MRRGPPADLTVFDPHARWTVEPEKFASLGRATPFAGWELCGRFPLTLCAGRVAWADPGLGGALAADN